MIKENWFFTIIFIQFLEMVDRSFSFLVKTFKNFRKLTTIQVMTHFYIFVIIYWLQLGSERYFLTADKTFLDDRRLIGKTKSDGCSTAFTVLYLFHKLLTISIQKKLKLEYTSWDTKTVPGQISINFFETSLFPFWFIVLVALPDKR